MYNLKTRKKRNGRVTRKGGSNHIAHNFQNNKKRFGAKSLDPNKLISKSTYEAEKEFILTLHSIKCLYTHL